jgi:starch phosphorylase
MSLPKIGYFSMEIAVDQSLHTYAGGLGFLAGSHMRSAWQLGFPVVGVTILWSKGYGQQQINSQGQVEIVYQKREYPFLNDTGIVIEIQFFGEPLLVKAFRLEPEVFGTVPIYFLTTDLPENQYKHRMLTEVLYDGDEWRRIGQELILGIAGFRVLEVANEHVDIFHLNEGHALPACFELLDRYSGNIEEVQKRTVFTTHTPVVACNETHSVHFLHDAGYFGKTGLDEARALGGDNFSLTTVALRLARIANGVSQIHGAVANKIWKDISGRCPIIAITNSVDLEYWQDNRIAQAKSDKVLLLEAKKQLKQELFEAISKETDKNFDPEVLTIVWARRFTEYKRPMLLFHQLNRIAELLNSGKIQVIYAGKFHAQDTNGRDMFNQVLEYSRQMPRLAVLTNYELELSRTLKCGADIWLNTPLRPMEASGTSGMSANMNGTIHFSTFDGWAVEGTYDRINGFLINRAGHCDMCNDDCNCRSCKVEDRNQQDYDSMMQILEEKIIPMYYTDKECWFNLMKMAIKTAESYFHSERMAIEYYNRLYESICSCP